MNTKISGQGMTHLTTPSPPNRKKCTKIVASPPTVEMMEASKALIGMQGGDPKNAAACKETTNKEAENQETIDPKETEQTGDRTQKSDEPTISGQTQANIHKVPDKPTVKETRNATPPPNRKGREKRQADEMTQASTTNNDEAKQPPRPARISVSPYGNNQNGAGTNTSARSILRNNEPSPVNSVFVWNKVLPKQKNKARLRS
jgi:hypothetical protein